MREGRLFGHMKESLIRAYSFSDLSSEDQLPRPQALGF